MFMKDVMVRKPLEIDAIAATQNRLLIPLNIPSKTDARRKVVSIEATLQRAIGNARCPGEACEVDLGRTQERVLALSRQRRDKNTCAEKLVMAKAHPFPAQTQIESQPGRTA